MAEEFKTVELEYSEDDILYYLEDEDGTEIGFAIEENGVEVEYYYEGFNAEDYEDVTEPESVDKVAVDEPVPDSQAEPEPSAELKPEAVSAPAPMPEPEPEQEPEPEIDSGAEPAQKPESESEPEPTQAAPEEPVEHGYLYKMATIAGYQGNKTRKQAEEKLDVARGKAEEQYGKAKKVAVEQAGKAKAKADEADISITREDVTEVTADLNTIAKEGAETAKELKEAYDDIMENFGFLVPKNIRRKLP